MKILWFTNTSSLYEQNAHTYHGGGWIESLEILISTNKNISLAICFLHSQDSEKKAANGVLYYPIKKKSRGTINKLVNNWSGKIDDQIYIPQFDTIIKDFNPDVIHIFGTEGPFGFVQSVTRIPTVIHLQGIINPYLNAYFPPNFNSLSILFNKSLLLNNLKGNSLFFERKRFKSRAKREIIYFDEVKYLMGRTIWDKENSALLAPKAKYFHINEVLRAAFYTQKSWVPKERKTIIILSTISETVYKGLDFVLKTAKVLKKHTSINFEWHLAGVNTGSKFIKLMEGITGIDSNDNNIKYLGRCSAEELIKNMLDADIFIHPSYIDNSPNSLCEAQMIGLPVIGCNVGGVSTMIEDGITGILVPANAPFDLAYKIKMLSQDKELSIFLSHNSKRKALVRHDKIAILSDLMQSYNSILNKV